MYLLSGGRRRRWVIGGAAMAATSLLALAGCTGTGTGGASSSAASAAARAGSPGTGSAGVVPAAPVGYTQVFLDNFGGAKGSPPSKSNWLYDIGTNWGNDQVEHDTNSTSNVYLDGKGDLVIQADESGAGVWTSGRIESTRDDFIAPPGGELEMTASVEQPDVPDATGYWPAFWALGSPMRVGGQWPQVGELDMFEDVNGLDLAYQTLHWAGNKTLQTPHVPCPDTTTTCQTGFHTYTVIIDRTNTSAESLQFLMDGEVEITITEVQVGAGPWQEAIDHGFFLLLDLAMGGTGPDGNCHCTAPTVGTTPGGQLKVAYVAVYEQPAKASAR